MSGIWHTITYMPIDYIAGEIFTPQEVFIFSTIAFIIAGVFVGLIAYLTSKIIKTGKKSKLSLRNALLSGYVFVATIILLFFVVPTMIKDNAWEKKNQTCATEAGYDSPADDNSSRATAESQSAYRLCLDL